MICGAIWSPKNYSGNYFWTSNVSLRRSRLDAVGDASTIRSANTAGKTSNSACACARSARSVCSTVRGGFHYKPAAGTNVAGMLRKCAPRRTRAITRKARALARRSATGTTAPQRMLGSRCITADRARSHPSPRPRPLSPPQLLARKSSPATRTTASWKRPKPRERKR